MNPSPARLHEQRLTDGSTSYNVLADFDGIVITFACVDKCSAARLVAAINTACWFQMEAA